MNEQQTQNKETPRPWYKEPWTWGLMAGPAIVVVAGFITLGYALSVKDTLVTDDYYKEGKNIVLEVERDKAAAQHHLSVGKRMERVQAARSQQGGDDEVEQALHNLILQVIP